MATQIFFLFTPIIWGRWTHFDEHIFQIGWFNHQLDTLQGTNISPKNGILKMIFLFPRWDMLIPWRVTFCGLTKISGPRIGSLQGGTPEKSHRIGHCFFSYGKYVSFVHPILHDMLLTQTRYVYSERFKIYPAFCFHFLKFRFNETFDKKPQQLWIQLGFHTQEKLDIPEADTCILN